MISNQRRARVVLLPSLHVYSTVCHPNRALNRHPENSFQDFGSRERGIHRVLFRMIVSDGIMDRLSARNSWLPKTSGQIVSPAECAFPPRCLLKKDATSAKGPAHLRMRLTNWQFEKPQNCRHAKDWSAHVPRGQDDDRGIGICVAWEQLTWYAKIG